MATPLPPRVAPTTTTHPPLSRRVPQTLPTFEVGSYAWLLDSTDVYVPCKITKAFKRGEKGQAIRLRPNESSYHNPEEVERKKRLSIGSRQRHHLRPSVTSVELKAGDTSTMIKADESSLVPQPDMVDVVDLSEPTLLHNLRLRFYEKKVFTAIGGILISVNPFESLPLFTPDMVDKYRRAGSRVARARLGPHVYALAHDAYDAMIEQRKDQSCVVTGESGSGKTELLKLFLQYLMDLSESSAQAFMNEQPSSSMMLDESFDSLKSMSSSPEKPASQATNPQSTSLSNLILTANPLLEAFGNARTVRNDNSSRFGKSLAVSFHAHRGTVVGAEVFVYLLEKSRLIHRGTKERTFHVFHQLVAGAMGDGFLCESLQLGGGADAFKYLVTQGAENEFDLSNSPQRMRTGSKASGSVTLGPTGAITRDAQAFAETIRAMRALGFSRVEEGSTLQVLAGLLHLGNVNFRESVDKEGVSALVANKDVLNVASEMLGLDPTTLERCLIKKDVSNVKERLFQNRDVRQARETRDGIAKHVYAKLFDWVVSRINFALRLFADAASSGSTALSSSSSNSQNLIPNQFDFDFNEIPTRKILMLDIFGFEVFDTNSFEQLCINYANEKLQQQFNRRVFQAEVNEYTEQGISPGTAFGKTFLNGIPNHDTCLKLFEEKPMGIFSLLEDEIFVPKGTDLSFFSKLNAHHAGKSECFIGPVGSSFGSSPGSGVLSLGAPPPAAAAGGLEFRIVHFAGEVKYDASGFLEKSSDRMDIAIGSMLAESTTLPFSQSFSSSASSGNAGLVAIPPHTRRGLVHTPVGSPPTPSPLPPTKRRREAKTLGTKFASELDDLLDSLESTGILYARCLKPNEDQSPNVFKSKLVLNQLRYAGVLDVCRIRQRGLPVRLAFDEFVWRYSKVGLKLKVVAGVTAQDAPVALSALQTKCQQILTAVHATSEDGVTGKTKVMLANRLYAYLETLRDDVLKIKATQIQRLVRGRLSRTSLHHLKTALRSLDALTKRTDKDNTFEINRVLNEISTEISFTHPIVLAAQDKIHRLERKKMFFDVVIKAETALEAAIALREAEAMGIPSDDESLRHCHQLVERLNHAQVVKDEAKRAMETRDLVVLEKSVAALKALASSTTAEAVATSQASGQGDLPPLSAQARRRNSFQTQDLLVEVMTLRDRLKKERDALQELDDAVVEHDGTKIKTALKQIVQLGMSHHKAATDATKMLKKIKRKDNESVDLTAARSHGVENVNRALDKLKSAESAKDVRALSEARQGAIELGLDRAPDVVRAAQLIARFEEENESETQLVGAIDIIQAKAKSKSGTAMSFVDIERFAEAIFLARNRGVPATSLHMIRAVETEQDCRQLLKVQNGFDEALRDRNYEKVHELLSEANRLEVDNDLIRRARAIALAHAPKAATTAEIIVKKTTLEDRAMELKRLSRKDFEKKRMERLRVARDPKSDWWNLSLDVIRSDEDFARKALLNGGGYNKQLAKTKLRYTGEVIPKAMTVLCGKDETLNKRAVLMNKALLGYCGDLVLPYPSILAQQIIEAAHLDPPLADELWLQILKQLSENPQEESEARAWQLAAIAASCLGPLSEPVENAVLNFFIYQGVESAGVDPVNREYARYALRMLERIVLEGPIGSIPTAEEITAYRERCPSLATVNLPDGTELTRDFPVAPAVFVQELVDACCVTVGIRSDLAYLFGLFVEVKPQQASERRTRALKREEFAESLATGLVQEMVRNVDSKAPGGAGAAAGAGGSKKPLMIQRTMSNKSVSFSGDTSPAKPSIMRRVSGSLVNGSLMFRGSSGNLIQAAPPPNLPTPPATPKSMAAASALSTSNAVVLNTPYENNFTSGVMEMQVPGEQAVVAVTAKDYDRRASPTFSLPAKRTKLQRSAMPKKSPEPLVGDEYLGDVLMRSLKSGERPLFVFRRKFIPIPGTEPPGATKDRAFIDISYLEGVEELLSGRWACSKKETVAELAALILADSRGGKAPLKDVSSAPREVLVEFIPITWHDRGEVDWCMEISKAADRLKLSSAKEARMRFLGLIETLPTYGLLSFHGRAADSSAVILAAGARGFYVLQADLQRTVIRFVAHNCIKRLNAFSESMAIDVRQSPNAPSSSDERLAFITLQGHEIAALIWELGVKFTTF